MQLRPYQQKGVTELRLAFREGARAPLYVAPTGSGKTVLFCHIAQGVTDGGRSVWIVVHRQELLMQTSRSLDALGIMHDLIAPGFTQGFSHVQICSVQTLVKRVEAGKMGRVDLIVFDEGHHATAGSWSKVIQSRPDARLLGVTATPIRLDGQGLGKHCGGVYDRLILGPSITELIEQGYLVKPVVYGPEHQLDMSGVRMVGGDYNAKDAAAKVDKQVITGDAVREYAKLCPGKPAIVFCASIGHAEHVAAEFRAAGFRSESIDGTLADGTRRKLIEGLGCGQLQVLTSCDIVSEGTDIPVVAAGILLRPTASLSLYLQQVGRVLRPAPGKDKAIILDHVGNFQRHGLPDDEWDWSLDGARRGGGTKGQSRLIDRTKQCPECFAVSPIASSCPICSHVYDRNMGAPKRVEGNLTEITPEMAARLKPTEKARADFLAKRRRELVAEAEAKGYKPRWVEHRLQSIIKKQQWADMEHVPQLHRTDAELQASVHRT